MSLYSLYVPAGASGANKDFFDVWNVAGSGVNIELLSVRPVVSGSVAVTASNLAVDLYLMRTTAVGTGGTAATYESATITEMTFSSFFSAPLNASVISGRLAPGGGATGGAILEFDSMLTEETADGSYAVRPDMVDSRFGGIMVRPGSGFKVRQGSVASVGNIAFNVLFKLV
jgi:hypothetical protein